MKIRIPKASTGDAFWGDTVEVEWWQRGRRSAPRVKRVTKRLREHYVATVTLVRDYGFGEPSDQRIHTDFFIPARHLGGATDGDKVLLALEAWDDPRDQPMGRVVEVLGQEGNHEVEMRHPRGVWPALRVPGGGRGRGQILGKRPQQPHGLDPDEVARRRDFREVLTMTIDPVDAKDFDDALSLQKLENGNWEVGVHIADVTHYPHARIHPGPEGGGSVPRRVPRRQNHPHAPEVLSNDLCSLRPHEDRFSRSVRCSR